MLHLSLVHHYSLSKPVFLGVLGFESHCIYLGLCWAFFSLSKLKQGHIMKKWISFSISPDSQIGQVNKQSAIYSCYCQIMPMWKAYCISVWCDKTTLTALLSKICVQNKSCRAWGQPLLGHVTGSRGNTSYESQWISYIFSQKGS